MLPFLKTPTARRLHQKSVRIQGFNQPGQIIETIIIQRIIKIRIYWKSSIMGLVYPGTSLEEGYWGSKMSCKVTKKRERGKGIESGETQTTKMCPKHTKIDRICVRVMHTFLEEEGVDVNNHPLHIWTWIGGYRQFDVCLNVYFECNKK